MQDLIHNVKSVSALLPASLTSFGAGLAVDTQGYRALMFSINVGTGTLAGGTSVAVKVQESDTTVDGDFADVASTDYIESYKDATPGWDRLLDAATDDEECFSIGVRCNTKRYKRLFFTETGAVTIILSAVAHLGNPAHGPVAA